MERGTGGEALGREGWDERVRVRGIYVGGEGVGGREEGVGRRGEVGAELS